MNERHDPNIAPGGGGERDPDGGLAPAEVAALAAHALDATDEAKLRILIEEQSRRVMDRMIGERVERLIAREELLKNQSRKLVGPRDAQLQEQQRQLDALASSLLGPQELLERAPATPNPDPATGPIARPKFAKSRAAWTLPRIPPPGLDGKPGPDPAGLDGEPGPDPD